MIKPKRIKHKRTYLTQDTPRLISKPSPPTIIPTINSVKMPVTVVILESKSGDRSILIRPNPIEI